MTRQRGAGGTGDGPITERRRRAREWDYLALERGLKRVIKLDAVSDAERVERELMQCCPDVFVRWRSVAGPGGRVEIFAGRDTRDVAEAIRLAGVIDLAFDAEAVAIATAKLGELLGYPACCARAYAGEPAALRRNDEWLRVQRRLEGPERVDPSFHPMLASFVPCTLTCGATRELVRRTTRANPHAPLGVWARLPTVLLVDRPGELLLLRPLAPVAATFPYELVASRTRDPRQALIAQGERLVVEPGRLIVQTGRRDVACFEGDAFLWWCDAVLDREWWQAAVTERCRTPGRATAPEPSAAPGAVEPDSVKPDR